MKQHAPSSLPEIIQNIPTPQANDLANSHDLQTPAPEQPPSTDAAWATISLQTDKLWLRRFLSNYARLFRINPLYEIHTIEAITEDRFLLKGMTCHNLQILPTQVRVVARQNSVQFVYNDGIKAYTKIEICNQGLRITDDYTSLGIVQRKQRLNEIDRSLVPWAHALRRHIVWRQRLQWLPLWGYFMDRAWLQMKPSNRRIALLLIGLTAADFMLFLFVLGVYTALN